MDYLEDLYKSEGWNDKSPKELIGLVSKDGKPYSVPVNIHRGNVLWYNKKVMDSNGLAAPKTFDEFFAVADKLKAKGITQAIHRLISSNEKIYRIGEEISYPNPRYFSEWFFKQTGMTPSEYRNLHTGQSG
jgi:maltose-binding protein MalE